MKTVLLFGVFDGVHEGHRDLFRQAKEHGDHLIVVVAQDGAVLSLKARAPQFSLDERMDALRQESGVDQVVRGDEAMGSYEVLREHKPDVIALGYDQYLLKEDLYNRKGELECHFEVVILAPFEPEKYHSSLLKNRR
jgi:FAD synthetase